MDFSPNKLFHLDHFSRDKHGPYIRNWMYFKAVPPAVYVGQNLGQKCSLIFNPIELPLILTTKIPRVKTFFGPPWQEIQTVDQYWPLDALDASN